MPEKINVTREIESGSFLNWVIVEAVSKLPDRKSAELIKTGKDGVYEFTLTMNGVEIPFIKTVSGIKKQLDDMVDKRARQLIDEKISDFVDVLEDTRKKLKESLSI